MGATSTVSPQWGGQSSGPCTSTPPPASRGSNQPLLACGRSSPATSAQLAIEQALQPDRPLALGADVAKVAHGAACVAGQLNPYGVIGNSGLGGGELIYQGVGGVIIGSWLVAVGVGAAPESFGASAVVVAPEGAVVVVAGGTLIGIGAKKIADECFG